jgi:cell division protein FtsB
VVETTLKLAVNVTLSVAAVSTLTRILPYQLSQQEKLQEIRAEVNVTEGRVNRLRDEFSHHFDPQQTKSIMQEQSNRVDPKQLQVVWTDIADLADTDEATP